MGGDDEGEPPADWVRSIPGIARMMSRMRALTGLLGRLSLLVWLLLGAAVASAAEPAAGPGLPAAAADLQVAQAAPAGPVLDAPADAIIVGPDGTPVRADMAAAFARALQAIAAERYQDAIADLRWMLAQ